MSNVTQTTLNINNTIKQLDQEALNNIANLSSINSESHKQLELKNINTFKRLLEDKHDCYYDNDNKYIDQKHDNLLVTNYDHQFLYPWVDLIIPNYTKPYCTNLKIKYNENANESSTECNYTLKKNDNSKQQMLYLTENQMFLVVISVLEQITNTPKDVPVIIDWVKVSRDSKLSQDVCKTFWWSFDKKHIKDPFGGCLFLQDWKHYLKVDESYFSELKNRVQYLIRLARECKEERERILYNNPNHV